MKARLFIAVSSLAFPLLALAGDPVVLEGPEQTTKAELDQCAAALAKRFASAGLKDLKAAAVEKDGKRWVEVTSKAEIAPETRTQIDSLARIAGSRGMLMNSRELTPDEVAKGFKSGVRGGDPKAAKAPAGTAWAWSHGADLEPSPPGKANVVLLVENPNVTWSEISVADRGADNWTFHVTPAATKRLIADMLGSRKGTLAGSVGLWLTFDGVYKSDVVRVELADDKHQLKEGVFTLPAAQAERVEAILRNPMPRALKQASGK